MAAIAPSTACTVPLKADLYNNVRGFLSDSQDVDAAAIERFVETAVNNYLLREASRQAQEAMAPHIAHLSEDELTAEIDTVLAEVRSQR
jgi:hypothetical protein